MLKWEVSGVCTRERRKRPYLAHAETREGGVHTAGTGSSLTPGNPELWLGSPNHERRIKTATAHVQPHAWGSKNRKTQLSSKIWAKSFTNLMTESAINRLCPQGRNPRLLIEVLVLAKGKPIEKNQERAVFEGSGKGRKQRTGRVIDSFCHNSSTLQLQHKSNHKQYINDWVYTAMLQLNFIYKNRPPLAPRV